VPSGTADLPVDTQIDTFCIMRAISATQRFAMPLVLNWLAAVCCHVKAMQLGDGLLWLMGAAVRGSLLFESQGWDGGAGQALERLTER
jgi:hypothetical protein